ncbi:PAN/Apple domain containing protein [Parasponia andersonii]|uniref:PAN/Apple domain containing protein n=1 Tax=Parasponia andersonii TaxID=3476 RepID=A0A2P5B4S8_PARAD|nr:PAN/Apple domain containing protein [Parasponia andersonii]
MLFQKSLISPTSLACLLVLVFLISLSSTNAAITGASDEIRKGESINVSEETIVSASGTLELGIKCSNINQTSDVFCPISAIGFPNGALKLEVGNESGCQSACLKNCSLIAYSYDQREGCFLWVNLRQLLDHQRNASYVNPKLSASEISTTCSGETIKGRSSESSAQGKKEAF